MLAAEPSAPATPRHQRAVGNARLALKQAGGRTRIADLFQQGTAKLRFPDAASGALEAVLVNTGGGMTGGDRLGVEVEVGPGASAVVTTQACEKIYRRESGAARVRSRLVLGEGARLDWLPQETILFDGGALDRRLDAELGAGARLLMCEAVLFGRAARGERVVEGALIDRFRIRREGRLVFADALRLDGPIAGDLERAATGAGARAAALVVDCASDAETRVEAARAALAGASCEWGVSGWNGCLVARLLSPDGAALRRDLVTLLVEIGGRAVPRVWSC
jgi:urease accessory protein